MDRREFLRQSALYGAGAVLTSSLGGCHKSAPTTPSFVTCYLTFRGLITGVLPDPGYLDIVGIKNKIPIVEGTARVPPEYMLPEGLYQIHIGTNIGIRETMAHLSNSGLFQYKTKLAVADIVENDQTAAWFINQRGVILAVQRPPGTNTVARKR